MKPRLNIYLDDHIAAQLTLISKRPGTNKSRIVNDALDKFFNPERDQAMSNAFIRRLDHMSKTIDRLDRNQSIDLESLALFIRYFLTITPLLPASDQASAHAIGRERFEAFIAQVGRRLTGDKSLAKDVAETLGADEPDLFAVNPDVKKHPTPTAGADDSVAELADDTLPPLRPVVFADDEDPTDDVADFDLEDRDLADLELEEFEPEGTDRETPGPVGLVFDEDIFEEDVDG